ncbi:MAG: protein jag [Chloroflexota bacterium]
MSDQRATIESIAPSVEEAIAKGADELGIAENLLDVEILDDGSKGLLGIGGRQARVRLTVKTNDGDDRPHDSGRSVKTSDEDMENAISITRETVAELLDKMNVHAEVTAHLGERESDKYQAPIIVDINGNDLSILIGQKAETLNALQFITRLIVGKEIGHSAPISVDVEGYRKRREENLRRIAKQMAEQAISSGRRQTLEPMPANERRIIHVELHENPDVETESVGQEPRRKVTINPTLT